MMISWYDTFSDYRNFANRLLADLKITVQGHGPGHKLLSVILSTTLMEKLGWQTNDRIDVLFDPETRRGIVRRQEVGWKLRRNGKTMATRVASMMLRPEMGLTRETAGVCRVTRIEGDDVHFSLPPVELMI